MMKKIARTFVWIAAIAFLAQSCANDDSAEDTGTDTGTETDMETDTGTYDVYCDGMPSACEDIGVDDEAQEAGCCDEDVLYWCDPASDVLESMDCGSYGLTCRFDYYYLAMRCQ